MQGLHSSQIQSILQLCHDDVDGIGAVAGAKLLSPPGVADAAGLDAAEQTDKGLGLLDGGRPANPHRIIAFVISCEGQ
jgi:hypothetical protein